MIAVGLVWGWLGVVGMVAPVQEPLPQPSAIRIQVGEQATRHGALLDLLIAISSRDREAAERKLVSAIERRPWLRVVVDSPEVALAVERLRRSESSRSKSKDGKKVSVTYRYEVSGEIAVPGDRERLESEVYESHTYTVGSGRQDPSDYEDRSAYEHAAVELERRACAWLLNRLDAIRPGGPDVGFRHKVRTRFGLKGDGLEVLEVIVGSPAERGGLVVGDRVRRIGAEGGTTEMDEIVRTWRLVAAGMPVSLEVERDKQRRTVVFTLPAGSADSPAKR